MIQLKKVMDKIIELFCISIMSIMTVLVTYQVITRYFFNKPSAVSESLSRYLFIWLVLFGSAYVFGRREHMNIVFIKDAFPFRLKILLEMLSELVIASFASLIMLYGGYKGALRQMIQIDSALPISIGIIYSAIPITAIFMIFYSVYNLYELFKKLKEGVRR